MVVSRRTPAWQVQISQSGQGSGDCGGVAGRAEEETEIGAIPESWSETCLASLVTLVQYGTSSRCHEDGAGYPVLRIPNVIGGKMDIAELKYLDAPPDEAKRHLLSSGDLLFVRSNGARANVGRCAVDHGEPPNALFPSYLIRARLERERMVPEFFRLFTEAARASLVERASGAADGQFNLNSQTIRATPVPVPLLSEQQEVVMRLSAVNAKLTAEEARRAALDRLFQSLLHHLMTGKVRVDHLIGQLDPEATA
jgi:type I restriction enzyme S subunit